MTTKSIKSKIKKMVFSENSQYSLPVRTGLDFWFDATQGVTKDSNDSVTQWNDLSGNAKHAVQPTVSDAPTYILNGLDKKPVLRFDGFNDNMLISTTAFRNNTNHSIFCVFTYQGKATTSDSYDPMLGTWTTGADRGAIHYIKDDGARYSGATYPYYPASGAYDTTTSQYVPGKTYLIEFHYNGATWEIIKNGVREASVSGSNSYTDLNGFKIAKQDIPLRHRKADYAEIIGYSTGLSELNRNLVREYLIKKWNLNVTPTSYQDEGFPMGLGQYGFNNDWNNSGLFGTVGVQQATFTTSPVKFGTHALNFNGTSNYIETSMPGSVTSHTVAFWVYPRDTSSRSYIVDFRPPDASPYGYWLYDNTGTSTFGGNSEYTFNFTPTLNTWSHWALVTDAKSGTMKWYQNGTELASAARTCTTGTSGRIVIGTYHGSRGSNQDQYFANFVIDNLYVLDAPLSAAEVTALYNYQKSF
jgi:hypothetical protein